MEWMILPLKRYAQFSGRARRKEYWMYVLFLTIVAVIAAIVDTALGFGQTTANVTASSAFYGWHSNGPIGAIWLVANLVPMLAVGIRRLHDIDKSGWWLLISFVPLVGGIVLLVFTCLEGTRGPNRFGPDPLSPTGDLRETFR
ncbi:DUF805 domain-containing protein [Sphingomonas abietis]|uniref:DUF805 domain-containing protein n=1 Tax=Sphingomonas abietis TaxID=3012344 RepID=A0ABY7NSP7_9SPHN|nr:DUF805 domain-containing protein [Sphingomonas abietis]WBO23602.1 DUF805 domain-containing protein [Sphingomonas abietis]